MRAEKGEVPASVTTAQPLDNKQRQEVASALKKFVKSNETIVMEEKVSFSYVDDRVSFDYVIDRVSMSLFSVYISLFICYARVLAWT